MADALNYAVKYSQALAQAYPNVLHFGELYNTSNNSIYQVTGADTIKIPIITTTGRKDANVDTIGTFSRNSSNNWETKVLSNQRMWDNLLHPTQVDRTNFVMSIQNATQVYNQEQKFPEMDAYCVSKIFADWTAQSRTATPIALTEENVLTYFDNMMEKMDEANVPDGRILYATPYVDKLLKNAVQVARNRSVDNNTASINRAVTRLEDVVIKKVPSKLMKTLYNFTQGYAPGVGAKQIYMFLVHPTAVITPVNYQFAALDEPCAKTQGKWYYYEESFEDVFILNKKADAIDFVIEV